MFVILSGVSGSGKNTIINHLLAEKENRFLIQSVTTRPRRESDNAYEFITEQEFDRREKRGDFFETIQAHTCRYATQNSELQKVIDNPQNLYMKDIDVVGAQKIVKFLKGKVKVLTIFLDVDDDVLYKRLMERGETDEKAKLRLSRGKMEREYISKYDLVIKNDDMEKTLSIIRERLKKEGF